MSLFDFFFPEQAQASHLRRLAEQGRAERLAAHRQRLKEAQAARTEASRTRGLEQRVAQLEGELAEAALAIEALLELVEESGGVSREAVAERIREIDLRDGVEDGRKSPPAPGPFTPNRSWPDP